MRNLWIILIAFLMLGLLACGFAACSRKQPAAPLAEPSADVRLSAAPVQVQSLGNPAKPIDTEALAFPNDRGGKLLAELLPSAVPKAPLVKSSKRLQFPTPTTLEALPTTVPPSLAEMSHARKPAFTSRTRPQSLSEGLPLAFIGPEPVVPERRDLPAGQRIHVASPRLDMALPLPPLATQYQEPISTEDATSEYSLAIALATMPSKRANPAPFLRLGIPDPFENRPAARLQTELEELSDPATTSPKPPR